MEMIEEKIAHLLSFQSENPSNKDERCLVVLVLLSHPKLVAASQLPSLWLSRQRDIEHFCQRLLPPPKSKNDDPVKMDISYARLVVMVLKRILDSLEIGTGRSILNILEHVGSEQNSMTLSTDDVYKMTTSWIRLMNYLLDFLDNNFQSFNNQPQDAILLTTQTLECINSCCASTLFKETENSRTADEMQMLVSNSVQVLWKSYCRAMMAPTTKSNLVGQQQDSNNAENNQLLHQTFQAILARASGDDNSTTKNSLIVDLNDSDEDKNRLHQEMEDFHRNYLLQHFTDHPSLKVDVLGQSIFNWSVTALENLQFPSKGPSPQSTIIPVDDMKLSEYYIHHLPKDYRSSWHEIMLLYTRQLAMHPSLPSILDKVQVSVLKLILVHVASPLGSNTSEDLRLLAWTTCAAWVDRLGYNWMLLSGSQNSSASLPSAVYGSDNTTDNSRSSSGSLGSASHLCALLRLASGEWRIQLGYRLTKYESSTAVQSGKTETAQQRAGTVHGCAQLLGSLVSYLTALADEVESKDFSKSKHSLPPEALLHLRDSLEDGFQSTYNYLFQLAKSNVPPERLDKEDIVIVQILATFLTEFDAFDAQTNIDSDEVLTALRFAMESATDLGTRERIITCLSGVLESARDDSYRVLLLKAHELLGNKIQSFLFQYWLSASESGIIKESFLRSIPWACHLTELWWTILVDYRSDLRLPSDVRTTLELIIGWMRLVLSGSHAKTPEVVAAINSCVGCFVTLQGGSPPNDEQGRILQAALQYCGALE